MATQVLELEISKNSGSISFDKGYENYRILVRIQNQPIGWLAFSKEDIKSISAVNIQQAIKMQLGSEIIRQSFIPSCYRSDHLLPDPEGVSVVVCTRNRTAQLNKCLQSLLTQHYSKYEVIVVDNAPFNNETQQLVSQLPVRYVREDCPGLDRARNKGISQAKYEIIAFTDDDALVDTFWLQTIAKAFRNKQVMGLSGYVAPAELETQAQHIFELDYGGMGHGFKRRFIRRENISKKELLWASSFGIGANMAFRRSIFQKIGGFDTALDVGTPSQGGGDIEFFHRLVHRGHLFVYDPSLLVWHYHRKEKADLYRQVFNNGCSFGCYLINCFRKKTVSRTITLQFIIFDWLFNWNIKNLIHPTKIPIKISLLELYGMLTSPYYYWKTKTWDKKLNSLQDRIGF